MNGIRAAERDQVPGSQRLTIAVARSLFKLMAYKDEYEVARLHMGTGFQDKLRQEFEGDFAIKYHLAPPILSSGKDARGRPLKRQFGQWIQTSVPATGAAQIPAWHRVGRVRLYAASARWNAA